MVQTEVDRLTAELHEEFPSFKLVPKAESWLMKAAGVLLLVVTFGRMNRFMTQFTTTLGYTVYVPDKWNRLSNSSRAIILRHERVHMRQRAKYTMLLFGFLYFFVFFPIGLAYFRMKFEKAAYEESMRATAEYYGVNVLDIPGVREGYIKHFTSAQYVWMWPFRRSIERWYDSILEELKKPWS